jgi:hypothetical protein
LRIKSTGRIKVPSFWFIVSRSQRKYDNSPDGRSFLTRRSSRSM